MHAALYNGAGWSDTYGGDCITNVYQSQIRIDTFGCNAKFQESLKIPSLVIGMRGNTGFYGF